MNKLFFTGTLVCSLVFLPQIAWAEEAPVEEAPVEEAPVEEAPVEEAPVEEAPVEEAPVEEAPVEAGYTPPPEAYDGVGGWAVVDPETNKVHGVIVCTVEGCGPEGNKRGKIGVEYMGCHADCVLRFQTRATSDGNVAGWGSSEGNDVTYNNDGTFTSQQYGDDGVSHSMKITPSETAKDPEGMNLHTGVSDIKIGKKIVSKDGSQSVETEARLDNYQDSDAEISLLYPEWENRLFNYLSEDSLFSNVDGDIDSALISDGQTTTENSVDEETGMAVETVVVDKTSPIAKTIREITQNVVRFFQSIFGGNDVV